MAKDFTLKVRVSDKDLEKLRLIATVADGNISDAVRMMIHAAKVVVRPVRVIECDIVDDVGITDAIEEYLSEQSNG